VTELRGDGSEPLTVWMERLDRLKQMALDSGVVEQAATAPLEPEGNILWMLEIEQWRSALDLMGGTGALTCAIAHHFDEVVYFDARPSMAAFARRRLDAEELSNVTVREGDPTSLPYPTASFDWIAAQDVLDALATRAGEARVLMKGMLAECRRLLRPGGGLYLRVANSRDFASGAPFTTLLPRARRKRKERPNVAALSPRWLETALRDAGFADVRLYYVEPSRELPMALIPATRSAVRVYESRGHFVSLSGRLRRLVARAGLHATLYSAQVALAYV
jgi:ubiquinone/menaquinone biosynthesis C-methylase UbiE